MSSKNHDIKNILIRVPNWIGDAVLCEPSVRAVRNNFPNADITILARPWVLPLFFNNLSVDRCIEYIHKGSFRGLSEKLKLIARLRRERYDLAVLFQNAFDAAFITFMAGIPERWGYSTDARGFLLTKSAKVKDDKCHDVFYYMNMLDEIGLSVDKGSKPKLYLSDDEVKWARQFLEENGIVSDKIIGINPGASYGKAKRWLPERFAEAANRLLEDFNAQVIIFGSKGDENVCREVIQKVKNQKSKIKSKVINLCGKTSLRELMVIISRCSLFITNDSGPMHISASLGVPTVAVFGSTDPSLTSPIGKKVFIIKKDIECSPCFERECRFGHYKCMDMVTVDDVYDAVISNSMKNIAVFIDRDGTINEDSGYIDSPDRLFLIDGASSAIKKLNSMGFKVVVISNQSGVGRGYFSKETLDSINKKLVDILKQEGAYLDSIYYCPHLPQDNCECRKPKTGLLEKAQQDLGIDIEKSYVVGDKVSDMELAENIGCKGILVLTGYGKEHKDMLKTKPCYIAHDLKDAVEWIIKDRGNGQGARDR